MCVWAPNDYVATTSLILTETKCISSLESKDFFDVQESTSYAPSHGPTTTSSLPHPKEGAIETGLSFALQKNYRHLSDLNPQSYTFIDKHACVLRHQGLLYVRDEVRTWPAAGH